MGADRSSIQPTSGYALPMVFRGQLDDRTTLVSVKDASASLAVGSQWIAAWDLGGRLYSMWRHGHTFRRGLNGRVLHKWRSGEPVSGPDLNPYDARSRVHIDGADAHALADESSGLLRRVIADIERNGEGWSGGAGRHPDAGAIALFERCARFDARASEEDARRFASVFAPVGILPPDQYLSIVLQATEGCSFGTCTFCDLYHQRYRVKPADEFAAHVAEVRDYLGDSAILRSRSVFLGAANALAVPMPRLLEFFGTIQGIFGSKPAVCAFVDGFTGLLKTPADYATLAARGLRRVYVGLESGHDPLLAFVRKPATRDQAVETVRALKAGGVSVGVIVMAGLGGRRFAAGHAADTTRAINDMALDAGDLLYFSDLVEVPGTDYPRLAAAEDVRPLALDDRLAQIASIRAGLAFAGLPPRAARYDVREFVY
jgi:hypothetical protein